MIAGKTMTDHFARCDLLVFPVKDFDQTANRTSTLVESVANFREVVDWPTVRRLLPKVPVKELFAVDFW